MDHSHRIRGSHCGLVTFDLIKLSISILILVLAWDIIQQVAPKACLLCLNENANNQQDANNQTFIIYVIGGFALVISFFVAFIQVQAKVKSVNRQKWINSVRKQLTSVINNIPNSGSCEKTIKEKMKEANSSRIQLELLLNPSEKDHRTLSYLLRIAYGIENLKIDAVLRDRPELTYLKKLRPLCCDDNRNTLITYIIRLSNAIFKREWERIKRGK